MSKSNMVKDLVNQTKTIMSSSRVAKGWINEWSRLHIMSNSRMAKGWINQGSRPSWIVPVWLGVKSKNGRDYHE
jgi:hypothetical protein